MKQRVLLLIGATSLVLASVAGMTAITAPPAAAATTPGGYVLNLADCVTNPQGPILGCLVQNLRGLLLSLRLPTFPNPTVSAPAASTPTAGPALPGTNAPTLQLPSNVTKVIDSLPAQLHTAPVADATAPIAKLRQLVPTVKPKATSSSVKTALPKLPTPANVRLVNIADTETPSNSGSPVSSTDVLMLMGLGLAGAAGVTAVTRRRAAAHS